VALLQNARRRNDRTLHHKLDAIADFLSDLMDHFASSEPNQTARENLVEAVGIEERT
jgi:hypothetical protein